MVFKEIAVFCEFGPKKWGIILESKVPPNLNMILKVSKFQNEFMKSLFLPKYEQKIVRISALCSEGRNPNND